MKVYQGVWSGMGRHVRVVERPLGGGPDEQARPLHHVKRHSFELEWGYGGSGPADTALSVLTDLAGPEVADRLYMRFKNEVVCLMPRDGGPLPRVEWELTEYEVVSILGTWDMDLAVRLSGEQLRREPRGQADVG